MRWLGIVAAAMLSMVALGGVAQAQDDRVQIFISYSGEDSTGRQLLQVMRDGIRASNVLTEVSNEDNAVFTVHLVTLPPGSDDLRGTIYSLTLTAQNTRGGYDYYVTSYVGTCGENTIRSCGNNVLAAVLRDMADVIDEASRAASR